MSGKKIRDADRAELRSVVAITFSGAAVVPAAKVGKAPRTEYVDPRTLFIESAYQRDVIERGKRLIRKIVENWDWTHFKPPIVVRRPDSGRALVVIDGQHTAVAAATHGGIPKIPVLVVEAAQVKDRAEAFVAHNKDRIALTPMQIHYAKLVAGNEEAGVIQSACDDAGVTVLRGYVNGANWKPRTTVAVGPMSIVLKFHKESGLRDALKVLAAADAAPITGPLLFAVANILEDRPGVDRKRLAAAIKTQTPAAWAAEAKVEALTTDLVPNAALRAVILRVMEPPEPKPAPSSPPKPKATPTAPVPRGTAPASPSTSVVVDVMNDRVSHRGRTVSLAGALCKGTMLVSALAKTMPRGIDVAVVARKTLGAAAGPKDVREVSEDLNPVLADAGLEVRITDGAVALVDLGA